MKPNIQTRQALPQEDIVIAEHFYKLWLDNQIPADLIEPDWQKITLDFIAHARENLLFKSFFATVETQVIASTSCQLFNGLYPHILKPEIRKYGYIWGVYVEPEYRGQGIGGTLTQIAVDDLKSLGCTHAILHASPSGQPVYSRLGFIPSNEMKLNLMEL